MLWLFHLVEDRGSSAPKRELVLIYKKKSNESGLANQTPEEWCVDVDEGSFSGERYLTISGVFFCLLSNEIDPGAPA